MSLGLGEKLAKLQGGTRAILPQLQNKCPWEVGKPSQPVSTDRLPAPRIFAEDSRERLLKIARVAANVIHVAGVPVRLCSAASRPSATYPYCVTTLLFSSSKAPFNLCLLASPFLRKSGFVFAGSSYAAINGRVHKIRVGAAIHGRACVSPQQQQQQVECFFSSSQVFFTKGPEGMLLIAFWVAFWPFHVARVQGQRSNLLDPRLPVDTTSFRATKSFWASRATAP